MSMSWCFMPKETPTMTILCTDVHIAESPIRWLQTLFASPSTSCSCLMPHDGHELSTGEIKKLWTTRLGQGKQIEDGHTKDLIILACHLPLMLSKLQVEAHITSNVVNR